MNDIGRGARLILESLLFVFVCFFETEYKHTHTHTHTKQKGGGLLVELMKQSSKTKSFAEVDAAIREKIRPYLYNDGNGQMVHIAYPVLLRNKDRSRTKMLPPLRAVEDAEEFDIKKYVATLSHDKGASLFSLAVAVVARCGGLTRSTTLVDKKKYKEICWDLEKRGNVGETVLHLCLLNATALHSDLAKRMLRIFPNLINDIYLNDEYYGEPFDSRRDGER